jgi:NodT family efflux transporter outer membrane factor (OMF) lipoprotein
MRAAAAAAAALLAAPSACAPVGPDYADPLLAAPAAFTAPAPAAATNDPRLLAAWWRAFDDPALAALIEEGIAANLDLAAAEARVVQARAQLRQAEALAEPVLDFDAGAGVGFIDNDNRSDIEGEADAGFSTSWEADLFGGIRRSIEAATASAEAEEERRRAVLVSLTAEIGTTYVELRGTQLRLELARQSLETQRDTLALVQEQRDAGVASELDVVRARSAVAALQAAIPGIQAQLGFAANRLAVLLARPPGALDAELAAPRPIPVVIAGPGVGIPADLVRRRPDLREAERGLAASTARIGVAVADLYPQLQIPGSLTFALTGLGTGAIVETIAASLAASVFAPIYDGGARQAAVAEAEAAAEESLIAYRQSLLLALEEAEAALIAYAEVRERRQALARALADDEAAYTLATQLYREGLVSFLDVLDAQRTLTVTRQQLAQADTELSTGLIEIYRAVGGGWEI